MAYYGDDDAVSVVSVPDEEVEDLSVDSYGVLREEAVSAQRLSMMRNAADHVEGRMQMPVVDGKRPWTNEKMFRVSGLYEWKEREPVELVEMMQQARVRTRVSAEMGLGKSTFLPFYIAKQMDHRVLYVAPDAAAVGQVNKYVRESGKGKFMRHWSVSVREWVCCMTYADFCGWNAMVKRAEMLKHFETIIFDEAFLKTPAISAALKIFAVVAGPQTNLLLCSANIRTDAAGIESMAAGAGAVKTLRSQVTPEEAVASGKLVDEYLVDRSLVMLPNDERVHDMVSYYESEGVDVRSLDSATDEGAIEDVVSWLKGDAVTPRVVVATSRFALAFNLPVSFVILWPLLSEWGLDAEKGVVCREVGMPQTIVNQALSRAGRGIVSGAGGMVMSPERAEETEMGLFDKLEEFVILCASSIKPLRNAYWKECYEILPNGLEPATAQQVRKVNLPVYVSIRFLAEDGLFSSKFSRSLMFFSQMDHFIRASEHELPKGYESWVEEEVFESGGSARCRVPVVSVGELKVVLHAVVAIAEGHMKLDRWRVPVVMSYHDHMDYQEEAPDVRGTQRLRLRRVRSFEKPPVVPPKLLEQGWTYSARLLNQELGGAGTRRAAILPVDRFAEAVGSMKAVVVGYEELPGEMQMLEADGGTKGVVELPDEPGNVESPGGSVVCTLPARVCERLNSGNGLSFEDFLCFLDIYRSHGKRVLSSRLFDCFSKPWSSVCLTLLDASVVERLVQVGLASQTYEMLGFLSGRFAVELVSTAKSSNVLKKRYLKVFVRTPTVDEVMHEIRGGIFTGIAQSDAFIERVKLLKYWMDSALVMAERMGVFLPNHITAAQRTLPIHGRTPLGHVGGGKMLSAPKYDEFQNPMSAHYIPRVREKKKRGSVGFDPWE